MDEILQEFLKDLGQGATWVAVVILLWKFVFKGAFESWLKSFLETQKELAIKKAEFERIKLDKCLPLLEKINGAIAQHSMMFYSYSKAITNQWGYSENLEELRLEQDRIISTAISDISIYLPSEFRMLLYKIRKVISCSWHPDPVQQHRALREVCSASEVMKVMSSEAVLYQDLCDCFYAMCNKYIGASDYEKSYSKILDAHFLDKKADTKRRDPVSQLALKHFLLHEYYGSAETEAAWLRLEKYYCQTKKWNRWLQNWWFVIQERTVAIIKRD